MFRIISSLTVTLIIFVQATKSDILVYTTNSNQIIEEFHDLPARFGAAFPINGLRALAIQSNPSNACTLIDSPPRNNTYHPIQKWVVIITRGGCSFEMKVRNAQKAGFHAAIVHNVDSNELEPMSANNDDGIDIPSMFVGETTGKIIIYNYQYQEGFALVLNDDLPFNINTHLIVPFSIVVGLCFIIMIGFMIMKCVREQRRLRRHRLPNSVLKKIPIIRFSKEEHMAIYEICAICIEDYVDGDRLRVLPCAHAFHNKCIDPWLTKNRRVCPICKRKVFIRGEPRRRRRHSTDDSMSDSDQDDTTPLLNPVEHANHGTFPASAPPLENDAAQQSGQRFNPFDRQINVSIPNAEVVVVSDSFWSKIVDMFHYRFGRNEANNTETVVNQQSANDDEIRNQSQLNDSEITVPISSYSRSSSSNNILNANLSGSLKRFNRKPAKIHNNDDDDDNYDSDDEDDVERFHECTTPNQSIYAPISTSQPSISNTHERPQHVGNAAMRLLHQRIAVAESPNLDFDPTKIGNDAAGASTSHQRIAVAALPNLDFDPTMAARPIYASSPTISGDRRGSDRDSFNRNQPASSSDYFV